MYRRCDGRCDERHFGNARRDKVNGDPECALSRQFAHSHLLHRWHRGRCCLRRRKARSPRTTSSHSRASELREVHCDHGHDGRHDHDHNSKHKDHDGKGKGKGDNKCGGKKKCPTPSVERIHYPGGGPGPRPGTGPTIGEGLGNIGKLPGGPALGDPGYSAPPAAGSSGGGGAGSPGGPSRDPVENGSGTTLKPN